MMIGILLHTPAWVFALFFGLLYLGYQQSKARSVPMKRLVLLPIVMLALSFAGICSTFSASALGIACWLAGVMLGVGIARLTGDVRQAGYSRESQRFDLPGSWIPLSLMMAIFATKYAVGVCLGLDANLHAVPAFIGSAGVAYGLSSGIFLGRMLLILDTAKNQVDVLPTVQNHARTYSKPPTSRQFATAAKRNAN